MYAIRSYYETDLPLSYSEQSSELFSRNGETIAVFSDGGKNRASVKLTEISPWLIQATLATEDRQFYDHFGFDRNNFV